jgi:hypothetical protein
MLQEEAELFRSLDTHGRYFEPKFVAQVGDRTCNRERAGIPVYSSN